ncbi:MAG: mevalonate kinase [Deltaproteobacteria bacterium]|nr:mevalonate kinase [Deltaproteobacteria bacterium]
MTLAWAQGAAPAKVILLGEHAAVYGHAAVGFALPNGARVRLRPGAGHVEVRARASQTADHASPTESGARSVSLADVVIRALGSRAPALDAEVDVEVPASAGLGTSAAVAVATLRALNELDGAAEDRLALVRSATDAEVVVHGSSSGLDPTLSALGGLTRFRRTPSGPEFAPVEPSSELQFVVTTVGGHGGASRSIGALQNLRRSAETTTDSALATLGSAAERGILAIERGELELLGKLMNLAHGTLAGLGLVADPVEAAIRAARAEGALGAKMSGAGGAGGAIVALTRDPARIEALLKKLGAEEIWIVRLAVVGQTP